MGTEQVERTRQRGGTWESADTIAVVKMEELKPDARMFLSVLAVLYILWMLKSEASSFARALEALWEHEPTTSVHPATIKAEKARLGRMRRHLAVAGFGTVVACFLLATCMLWGYILWMQAHLEVTPTAHHLTSLP
jgi:uncharacterized BrkB/YihY/UPF0761 family membrane protein